MLSVLIPTYNYNCYSFVEEIHLQLTKEQIDFEIICFDDGSKSELNTENNKINLLENSEFNSLEKNIGRSAIRNLLAKEAQYKWLLFLDADVFPKNKNFIPNYIARCLKDKKVFCGGIEYENTKENSRLLRYKFGKKHEEILPKIRNKKPYKYFFTSNFLIEKSIFNSIKFEEKLQQYGREDLLFSLALEKEGYRIAHINNPVFHLGLDDDVIFINKTKQAMENLIFLENNKLLQTDEILLLKIINRIFFLKLHTIFAFFFVCLEKTTLKTKSVFFLDLMKVSYLCKLKQKS